MAHAKLSVPKFNGDILQWDAFWTRFKANIDSDPFYTEVDKLCYLQEAIEDPAIDSTLFNGVKNEHHYSEVVRRLHERYDKPKKIHAIYCNRLQQTSMVKHNKQDMQTFLDQAQHTVIGLEATGQCSSDAIITNMLLQRLPRVDKEAWMQLTLSETTIRPPQELFQFISGRIDMIDAGLTDPDSLSKGGEPRPDSKPEIKKERRREKTPPKQQQRGSIHVFSQQPYKWDCKICGAPEKHPLYFCDKFKAMDIKTRRDKVRELKCCFNCFVPGHRNTDCRSQSSCRICSGRHNTMLHQEAPPDTRVGVNCASDGTVTTLSMTASVKITGPAGHTLVARALLDSGASQSLVTSRVVQAVQATTEVHRTSFTGVANMPAPTSAKRAHIFISPLQGSSKKLPITAAIFDTVAGDSMPTCS